MRKISLFFILVYMLPVILSLAGCGKKEVKPEEVYEPEKYLAEADVLMGEQKYDEARKLLLEVKNRDSQKKYGAIAQLKIADTYIKDDDPDLAIVEYRKFIDNYPDNQFASYAQYQIAMAYFSQIKSPDRGTGVAKNALAEFNRLKQLYPRNPYRDIVDIRIEKAENTLAEGDFMIGEFYFKKESYQAAIGRLEGLLVKWPAYKNADKALLLIGKSYRALKMNDKAKDAFHRLIEKYPASDAAKEATRLSLL